uniref:Uncharacterized protein n=1 Tax=Amblyomma cajennense TaxID=34607 RepID=A0A023FE62_AMBCJ
MHILLFSSCFKNEVDTALLAFASLLHLNIALVLGLGHIYTHLQLVNVLAARQKNDCFINCTCTVFVPDASCLSRDTTSWGNCNFWKVLKCAGTVSMHAVAIVMVAHHCWRRYKEIRNRTVQMCAKLVHCINLALSRHWPLKLPSPPHL